MAKKVRGSRHKKGKDAEFRGREEENRYIRIWALHRPLIGADHKAGE